MLIEAMNIVLLFFCVIELLILINDRGIFATYYEQGIKMLKAKGILQTALYTFSFAWGIVHSKVLFGMKRKNATKEKIAIAFYPTGGLGDYIISAKVLEEIQNYSKTEIDVFCEKMEYGKAIYENRKNVNLQTVERFYNVASSYDIALKVEHFIHVVYFDKKKVESLSNELAARISYIIDNWDDLYVNISEQCWRERIQFEKCRTLGLDRWTELRMGKAFIIADKKVFIPLSEEYRSKYLKMSLSSEDYITLNYGSDIMKEGYKQLKMWPKEYYDRLVTLIHKEFPKIKVVQLGTSDAEKIEDADYYVLGKNLELIKWILKGTKCHVDCEGGLVHLATQLGGKCIVLFGPTPVHMYSYEKNINLESTRCSNCMGLHSEWAYICARNAKNPICMKSIEPESVLDKLRGLIA